MLYANVVIWSQADMAPLNFPHLSLEAIFHIVNPSGDLTVAPAGRKRRKFVWRGEPVFLNQAIDHRLSETNAALDLVDPDKAVGMAFDVAHLAAARLRAKLRSLSRNDMSIAGINSVTGSLTP